MSKKALAARLLFSVIVAIFAACGYVAAQGQAAAPPAPRPDNPESLRHINAAKKLAGNDAVLALPFQFYCTPGGARANSQTAPALDPVKLFDNVYALGDEETTVYALTTRDGIILIDSGYQGRVEKVLLPQFQKLGLDPANVKYILLGHGHGDHFGGSKYFQDHYKTKVGTTALDWDLMYAPPPPAQQGRGNVTPEIPARDLVLAEGQPITLGELTVTPVLIPGHTPGALAYIFPVKDQGKAHVAGLFGGTILTVDRITTEGLKTYVQSVSHYLDVAKRMKVDVELQNHPIFDGTPARLARLRARTSSDPHPFLMPNGKYLKFWNIVSECVQAEIARRGATT
jgi:metallo-beta-lactamase class B